MKIDAIKDFKDALNNYFKQRDIVLNAINDLDVARYNACFMLQRTVDNDITKLDAAKAVTGFDMIGFESPAVKKIVDFVLDNCISKGNENEPWFNSLECINVKCNAVAQNIFEAVISNEFHIMFRSTEHLERMFEITIPIKDSLDKDIENWYLSTNGLYSLHGFLHVQEHDKLAVNLSDRSATTASKMLAKAFDETIIANTVKKFMNAELDDDIMSTCNSRVVRYYIPTMSAGWRSIQPEYTTYNGYFSNYSRDSSDLYANDIANHQEVMDILNGNDCNLHSSKVKDALSSIITDVDKYERQQDSLTTRQA